MKLTILKFFPLPLLLAMPASAASFDVGRLISVAENVTQIAKDNGLDFNSFVKEPTQSSNPNFGAPKPPFHNFYSSKRELKKHISKNPYTFYTNCKINVGYKNKLTPDLRSCNYQVRTDAKRARRIEFEHITPVSWAKDQFSCWDNGGRSNCGKNDKQFKALEADPVNLVPSVGEVNGNRSNYRYSALTSGFDYGTNGKVLYDKHSRKFMPPKEKQGWVARVHLYMKDKYGFKYSSSYMKLINAWAKLPATQQECDYNKLLNGYGFNNPYTVKACSS